MRLLVSPRDVEEAKRSLAADIIDVKRPAEGSLGGNFPWIIRAIKELAGKPVSAAIGDFDFRPGGAALAAYGAAHAGADYVKVGLMFDGSARAAEFISAVIRAVKEEFPEKYVVICSNSPPRARGPRPSASPPATRAPSCGTAVPAGGRREHDGASEFPGRRPGR